MVAFWGLLSPHFFFSSPPPQPIKRLHRNFVKKFPFQDQPPNSSPSLSFYTLLPPLLRGSPSGLSLFSAPQTPFPLFHYYVCLCFLEGRSFVVCSFFFSFFHCLHPKHQSLWTLCKSRVPIGKVATFFLSYQTSFFPAFHCFILNIISPWWGFPPKNPSKPVVWFFV